jgi:peptidoglycan/LPS O-acetylase OafA/YrhL
MFGLSHIKGFDGLRAIAALGVVGFHLELPGFAFGWSGVYLFFVLSGFLITRILIDAKDAPDYFLKFWTRRAVRIFPIYYLVLLGVIIASLLTHRSVAEWPWFAFYLQNFLIGFSGTDFNLVDKLGHTWTLANEEQFYWLWPIIVYFTPTRWIARIAVVMILIAWVFRSYFEMVAPHHDLATTALPSTIDFLSWGALGAIFYKEGIPYFRIAAGAFVAVFIAAGLATWTTDGPALHAHGVLGLGLLAPFFLAIALLATSVPAFAAILEVEWLRYLGRISYGIYLYHFPLLAVADGLASHGIPISGAPAKIALTILVSIVSFELIERPLLARKDWFCAIVANGLRRMKARSFYFAGPADGESL